MCLAFSGVRVVFLICFADPKCKFIHLADSSQPRRTSFQTAKIATVYGFVVQTLGGRRMGAMHTALCDAKAGRADPVNASIKLAVPIWLAVLIRRADKLKPEKGAC